MIINKSKENAMNLHSLKAELTTHLVFRTKLREAYPDLESEELKDTLEGLTNLPEMLTTILRSHLDDNYSVKALKLRINEMRERLKRLEVRADKKRALVAEVMAEADIPRLSEPDFTVSLLAGRKQLVVVEEPSIPEEYWRPQAPKLDRVRLLENLKAGTSVPGASLSNAAPSIAVRTK